MECPYCEGKIREIDRNELIDECIPMIIITYICEKCGKEISAEFKFKDWFDVDDNTIIGDDNE